MYLTLVLVIIKNLKDKPGEYGIFYFIGWNFALHQHHRVTFNTCGDRERKMVICVHQRRNMISDNLSLIKHSRDTNDKSLLHHKTMMLLPLLTLAIIICDSISNSFLSFSTIFLGSNIYSACACEFVRAYFLSLFLIRAHHWHMLSLAYDHRGNKYTNLNLIQMVL